MDAPSISGNYRGFVFFKSEEQTNFAEEALSFWKRFAKTHEHAERVGKRVLGSIITTNKKEVVEEISRYYAPIPPRSLERVSFEYLRTCFGQGQISWKKVYPKVLQLQVIFDTRIVLRANPFFRFFKQFKGFCGILDEVWQHYNANGSISVSLTGVPPGVREMEHTAIEWMNSINHNDTVLEDIFLLLLDRYRKIKTFKRKEAFFEKIVGGTHLSKEIRRRAVKQITKLEQLMLLKHRHADMAEDIDRQIRNLEEFIASTESHREKILTRLDLLDRTTVESSLLAKYSHLESKLIRKLAKIIVRIRKNTFSARTKAPKEHIGVLCTSMLEGKRYIVRVLPGQPPYKELLVSCDKEVRFVYPLGSLFVVWLPAEVTGEEKYYRSYNNVALHIDFPVHLSEPKEQEEESEEILEEYQVS